MKLAVLYGHSASAVEPEKALLSAVASSCSDLDDESESVRMSGISRAFTSDRGEFAMRQVLSLELLSPNAKMPKRGANQLNAMLPGSIRVFKLVRVDKSFSARRMCEWRSYECLLPTYAFAPPPPQTGYPFKSEVDSEAALDQLLLDAAANSQDLFGSLKRATTIRPPSTLRTRSSVEGTAIQSFGNGNAQSSVWMPTGPPIPSTPLQTPPSSLITQTLRDMISPNRPAEDPNLKSPRPIQQSLSSSFNSVKSFFGTLKKRRSDQISRSNESLPDVPRAETQQVARQVQNPKRYSTTDATHAFNNSVEIAKISTSAPISSQFVENSLKTATPSLPSTPKSAVSAFVDMEDDDGDVVFERPSTNSSVSIPQTSSRQPQSKRSSLGSNPFPDDEEILPMSSFIKQPLPKSTDFSHQASLDPLGPTSMSDPSRQSIGTTATFTLSRHPKGPLQLFPTTEEDRALLRKFRITPALFESARSVLDQFRGTHDWRHYVTTSPSTGSASLFDPPPYFLRVTDVALSNPSVHYGVEWVRMTVTCPSSSGVLARDQLRRMAAMLVMVVRTGTPRSVISGTFGNKRVNIPAAPIRGTGVADVGYAQWNTFNANEAVDFDEDGIKGYVDDFAENSVRDEVFIEEEDGMEFEEWLKEIDRNCYLYRHFLNSRGVVMNLRD